jgi:hypothetical protein
MTTVSRVRKGTTPEIILQQEAGITITALEAVAFII